MARLRKHLSYANVMATIAVFFAVGGGAAYATHLVVRSSDIVNDQVRSIDVRNDNLTGGGLSAGDLRAESVGSSEVADSTLTHEDIGVGEVRADELGLAIGRSNTTSVPPSGGVGAVDVSCSPGERLLSGGAHFDYPSGDLSQSRAIPGGSWRAEGQNNGHVAQTLTVQALCLAK